MHERLTRDSDGACLATVHAIEEERRALLFMAARLSESHPEIYDDIVEEGGMQWFMPRSSRESGAREWIPEDPLENVAHKERGEGE